MRLLSLLEVVIFISSITIITTQIFIPALSHQPLFPWLRRRVKLQGKIIEAQEDIETQKMEEQLSGLKKNKQPETPAPEKPKKVRKTKTSK